MMSNVKIIKTMEENLKERLLKYIAFKGIAVQEFEKLAGLSNGAVSKMGDNTRISTLDKISNYFTDLNLNWVRTGEGEMLKPAATSAPSKLSPDKGVPFYDLDFACGFLDYLDATTVPTSYVNLPGTEDSTCWCRASGNSMQPQIDNGDYVCLKRIDDPSFLVFGDTYAFDCTNGMRTIKKLGRGSQPDTFRLIPVNKEVDEQDIPLSIIRHIFRVIAVAKYL